MNLGHYLFSFSGRINRAKQWAFLLVAFAFQIVFMIVISSTIGFETIFHALRERLPVSTVFGTPQAQLTGIILCALYLLLLYMDLAVRTKRLHDRNRSAWWLLVFFVLPIVLNVPRLIEVWPMFLHLDKVLESARHGQPYVMPESPLAIIAAGVASLIGLWALVEFYFFRGTQGDNRYGPDPLAHRGPSLS